MRKMVLNLKKGQAAMEFLMTYGWALLILLIAISALAYFGVLNPSKLLPETCIVPLGTNCIDFSIISNNFNTVQIRAVNSLGIDITGVTLTLVGDYNNPTLCSGVAHTGSPLAVWRDGAFQPFTFDCTTPPTSGSRFKSDILIAYTKLSTQHTKVGRIVGTVE